MSKLYNLDELYEMSGNDKEFVEEMVFTFLNKNKEYLEELNNAFEIENWKQVKFFAHKMKPSILLFKIEHLKKTVLDLNEYAGNEIFLEKIPSLIGQLNSELSSVFASLNQEFEKK